MADWFDTLAVAPRIPEVEAEEDWRGEGIIKNARRSHQNAGNYTLRRELADRLGPANKQRPNHAKPMLECRQCGKALDRRNTIGYCKEHRHLSGYLAKR